MKRLLLPAVVLVLVAGTTAPSVPAELEPLPGVRAKMGDLTNAFDFSRAPAR